LVLSLKRKGGPFGGLVSCLELSGLSFRVDPGGGPPRCPVIAIEYYPSLSTLFLISAALDKSGDGVPNVMK
jgi:hypothetical protein